MKNLLPAFSRLLLLAFLMVLYVRQDVMAQSTNITPPSGTGNGQFGANVTVLTNGNFVVTDPLYDEGVVTDVGAVYLYNGATLALISTLKGSSASDQVGNGGITALSNGNYVVRSLNWDNGSNTDAGAVTWGSGTAGVPGIVSVANSLTGSTASDAIGNGNVTALSNGNYVVRSTSWDNGSILNAGAVTWGSGTAGVSGVVSASNSLVGSSASDGVGNSGITALSNGNYVVRSTSWDNGSTIDAGAVTLGSGTAGVSGVVSASNSLVGSSANDVIGNGGITALTNGNYVVRSNSWDNGSIVNAGAVTWRSGTAGVSGVVSASNSLVGSTGSDGVGSNGTTALSNGNYVVISSNWDNGSIVNAGAVTWGSGTAGASGAVSVSNSLVGSSTSDAVGGGGITVLTNGNYVVRSTVWDKGSTINVGAITWSSGTAGITGVVSASNSLVGSSINDQVGNFGITALSNGNYVVSNASWDNGSSTDVGAVTWGSGTAGITGAVSIANSLIGGSASDGVGNNGIVALTNGNYVVRSTSWTNGSIVGAGAVTWGNGTIGITGLTSPSNSLVGSNLNDNIGNAAIIKLSNGNYVVSSYNWKNGSNAGAGAATWGSGTAGVSGPVSASNSLVGSSASDQVGSVGITALSNGSYVVISSNWDNSGIVNVGAVTWGSGTAGVSGAISASNSLVGSSANDAVGNAGITALSNSNYLVRSYNWQNGTIANAGAVTWGSGTASVNGVVSALNSLVGSIASDQVGTGGITALSNGNYVVNSPSWDNSSIANAGAVTYANSGIIGLVTTCNSVTGNVAGSGYSIQYSYNTTYDYLIVGRPAENLVTRFLPSGQAMAQNTDQATMSLSGNTTPVPFIDYSACRVLASVKPSGTSPVNGNITAKAYVEGSAIIFNGQALVRRSLEITPAANGDVATATPTLYFTQADFDDYNAVNTNGTNLPTSPSDAAGIANIRINQQHGTSPTGISGSYTGWAGSGPATVLIDPADTSIVWNSNLNRWEISFDITGFSGFFVYTGNGLLLPLTWINVSGTRIDKNKVQVEWKVQEQQVNSYTIERSTDGMHFTAIGTFSSKGNGTNTYGFTDAAAFSSGNKTVYYRIQQQGADGKWSYSKTVQLSGAGSIENISVYPNPFHAAFTVRSSTVQSCSITDNAGRTLLSVQLATGTNTIQSEKWAAGTYFLKTENGESYKLIKK